MTTENMRPYRVEKDATDELWAIWTAKDETPGSQNNYVICDSFQREEEAIEFCNAVNDAYDRDRRRMNRWEILDGQCG